MLATPSPHSMSTILQEIWYRSIVLSVSSLNEPKSRVFPSNVIQVVTIKQRGDLRMNIHALKKLGAMLIVIPQFPDLVSTNKPHKVSTYNDTDFSRAKETVCKITCIRLLMVSDDGLSAIATILGTPLMFDSYTSDMCIQSWGRSRFAREMIELRVDVELKDTIVVAMPKLIGEGFYMCTFVLSMSGNLSGVHVVRPVSKKKNVNTSGNKKKDVESRKEVSNTYPFDVLNSVENDVDLGTNVGTSNLASKEANSSGSSFWNVGSSSTSTTPIVDKIDKLEKLIIDGKVSLVDDEGKPLKKVDYPGNHDSEDEVELVDNEMTSFLASERVGFGTNSLLE
ncbi:hypothetical protein Tco_0702436 [Tanacetum coccineum]|uniref:Uncharacterized protein n=1 Tax=Tanacetum coccineum TaxID=301880 RepID=A0ABQ4XXQ5_9ASTR